MNWKRLTCLIFICLLGKSPLANSQEWPVRSCASEGAAIEGENDFANFHREFSQALERKDVDFFKILSHIGLEISPAYFAQLVEGGLDYQQWKLLLQSQNVDARFLNDLRVKGPWQRPMPLIYNLLDKNGKHRLSPVQRLQVIEAVLKKGLDIYQRGGASMSPWAFMTRHNSSPEMKFLLRKYKPKNSGNPRFKGPGSPADQEDAGNAPEIILEAIGSPTQAYRIRMDNPFPSLKVGDREWSRDLLLDQFPHWPEKTMKLLYNNGFIQSGEEEAAKFLFEHREKIGPFGLGEFLTVEGNKKILLKFLNLIDWKDRSFMDSLRWMLVHLIPPGEAQRIDRLIEGFAEVFAANNSDFSNETTYLLAFSAMMLNTDLHSRQVKKSMTVKEYLFNLRNIRELDHLPDAVLLDVYQDIKRTPFQITAGPGNGKGPLKDVDKKARLEQKIISSFKAAQLAGSRPQLDSTARKILELYAPISQNAQEILRMDPTN